MSWQAVNQAGPCAPLGQAHTAPEPRIPAPQTLDLLLWLMEEIVLSGAHTSPISTELLCGPASSAPVEGSALTVPPTSPLGRPDRAPLRLRRPEVQHRSVGGAQGGSAQARVRAPAGQASPSPPGRRTPAASAAFLTCPLSLCTPALSRLPTQTQALGEDAPRRDLVLMFHLQRPLLQIRPPPEVLGGRVLWGDAVRPHAGPTHT